MKTTLVFLLMCFSIFPYWFRIEPPGFHNFNTVHFVNQSTAFIGTTHGEIFKTIDGGLSWQFVAQPTNYALSRIRLNAIGTGLAVGEAGTVLRSADFGGSWALLQPIASDRLYDLEFISNNTLVAVGGSGIIRRSTDGGLNWVNINSGTSAFLHGIHFIDSLRGFVVGQYKTILKTSDGGISWQNSTLPYSDDYMDVCFSDSVKGIIVGKFGTILKTSDGGVNWQNVGTYGVGFSRITLISENIGWAVGYSNLTYKTINGGQTWFEVFSPVAGQGALSDVSFVDEHIGMTVGTNNVLMKTIYGGLPVELKHFSCSSLGNGICLQWGTVTETNNFGFEIERREENSAWKVVGFQAGKGTTTEHQEYTFVDHVKAANSSKLFYRLKQIDFSRTYKYSDVAEITIYSTTFSLEQNYPNPFNPVTTIKFSTPPLPLPFGKGEGTGGVRRSGQRVKLVVYDMLGREVAVLVNEEQAAGSYEVKFDAAALPSGTYFYELRAGDFREAKKMILLR